MSKRQQAERHARRRRERDAEEAFEARSPHEFRNDVARFNEVLAALQRRSK